MLEEGKRREQISRPATNVSYGSCKQQILIFLPAAGTHVYLLYRIVVVPPENEDRRFSELVIVTVSVGVHAVNMARFRYLYVKFGRLLVFIQKMRCSCSAYRVDVTSYLVVPASRPKVNGE